MSYDDDNQKENIAATLARVLPEARFDLTLTDPNVMLATLPGDTKFQVVDLEKYLPSPRRKEGSASFSDAISFAEYVKRHQTEGTVAWCKFDPQTFALSFTAVLDDHSSSIAGWRGHRANLKPDMSTEWKLWKAKDAKVFGQVDFAEFIETNSADITTTEGYPTDLQMLTMATNFVAQEERTLKSSVRLQSGGVRLTYVADPDAGTTESMEMFSKFAIGIPVFQDGSAFAVLARLKYRLSSGKVSFFYELIRADRVHELAAKRMIDQVRESLAGVPLLMGQFD